ncbi:MAG: hypothetical protein GY722_04680 [bacterium]|nr:hypothetical protein [bacterium]
MIGNRLIRDEEGSALVISLIFIGVWAIVIMAVLGLVESGFHVAAGTADQRDRTYAADNAVAAAIFSTQGYLVEGGDPADCPPFRFVQTENPGGPEEKILDVAVQIECTDAVFTPAWFPMETWDLFGDGSVEWLDDPSDDPIGGEDPPVFDGGDIPILDDALMGRFGDTNDSGGFDEGEPLETPQYVSGDVIATASMCPSAAACAPALKAFARLESESGVPEVTIVHWQVIR